MDVTVAVVPRERFRFLERSLKSLFETIPADVPVIVVDGGAPNKVLNAIKNLQKIRPFELIETHEFVLPNRARNIALKKVETKYIAFCDNDLEHSPNWLEALVESAEKHQAAAVAPTTLIGPTQTPRIHHAGGTLKRVYDDEGRVSLVERHNFANVPLSEAIENG
ncbi:MAG: glycosyltransferase family 2 protein, partial [Pseudomonadota bacterium]